MKKRGIFSIILFLIILNIVSSSPLLNVDIEIPTDYKRVLPGEEIKAIVTLYEPKPIEKIDVKLKSSIKDMEGKIITSKEKTVAIEQITYTTVTLYLPKGTKPGDYFLYIEVSKDNVIVSDSRPFRVVEKTVEIPEKFFKASIWILSIAFIIFIFVLIFYYRKIEKRLEELGKISEEDLEENGFIK